MKEEEEEERRRGGEEERKKGRKERLKEIRLQLPSIAVNCRGL